MTLSESDLGWISGLLEGEGYFGLRRGSDLVMQLTMTDKDVVDKFHDLVGVGTRRERKLPSGKIAYGWTSTNQLETVTLMEAVLPLMGARRSDKILTCLGEWRMKPLPKAQWTHCKNGHELIGDNLGNIREGSYEKRRCKECGRMRQRKYRQSKRGIIGL